MSSFLKLRVGARDSPLSKAQVEEVLQEMKAFYPALEFEPIYLKSGGDKDQKTSLRTLGKTDFFTKEIDELLLQKKVRVAIHSAKDLPEPLPKGLQLVALTRGVDSSDVLVLRENESFASLKPKAKIATSSVHREENVKRLRNDFEFVDIRGTIGERLKKLESLEVDGVVIAEAAIIRLHLTHLNRIRISGTTSPHQGRLAILARSDDDEIAEVFKVINR